MWYFQCLFVAMLELAVQQAPYQDPDPEIQQNL